MMQMMLMGQILLYADDARDAHDVNDAEYADEFAGADDAHDVDDAGDDDAGDSDDAADEADDVNDANDAVVADGADGAGDAGENQGNDEPTEDPSKVRKKKTIPTKRGTATTRRWTLSWTMPYGKTITLKVDDGYSIRKVKGMIKP